MQRFDFIKNEDNFFGYTLFLPDGYTEEKTYPLILALHGAGERGNGTDELERGTHIGLGGYLKRKSMNIDAIVLCPQCPKDRVWNHLIFDLKKLLDSIVDTYSVDKDRVTVTGMSMGGFGTWEMGMMFPETFAALAPVCGGGMAWRTEALKNIPIWAFHGDRDNVVDISNSVEMVNRARAAGSDVKFTVFNGVAHASWDPAYLDTNVVNWLISQKKK